jgi:hypothetical protein
VSDGAGAVLLMKRSVAMQKGLPILGVFRYLMGNIKVMIYDPWQYLYTDFKLACCGFYK